MSERLEPLLSQTSDMAEFNKEAIQFIAERTALIQQLTANNDYLALTNLQAECQADIVRWQDRLKHLSNTIAGIEKTKQYVE